MIEVGDKIIIKDNLLDEIKRLDFADVLIKHFKDLIGTKQTVHAIWNDEDQKYVTIDLCVEIPIQCCEK